MKTLSELAKILEQGRPSFKKRPKSKKKSKKFISYSKNATTIYDPDYQFIDALGRIRLKQCK